MKFFMILISFGASYVLIRYREMIGDIIGGRYTVTVAIGVLVFFWTVAYAVGATDIFFRPLLWLVPGARN